MRCGDGSDQAGFCRRIPIKTINFGDNERPSCNGCLIRPAVVAERHKTHNKRIINTLRSKCRPFVTPRIVTFAAYSPNIRSMFYAYAAADRFSP